MTHELSEMTTCRYKIKF